VLVLVRPEPIGYFRLSRWRNHVRRRTNRLPWLYAEERKIRLLGASLDRCL